MTSVNEHDDTDETAVPERLAALLELPKQDGYLGLGFYLYRLLTILLKGVAGTDINIEEDHPTLGGVFAVPLYTRLRAECLEYLGYSQRPELLAQAERLPENLWTIMYGRAAWGKDEQLDAEYVGSQLEVACCLAGLDVYRDLLADPFRADAAAVVFIIERTGERRLENMRERWAMEDARDRGPGETFEEFCSRGLREAGVLGAGDGLLTPPPLPLPSSSPLWLGSVPVETDELVSSSFAPALPAAEAQPAPEPEPAKMSRKGMGGATKKVAYPRVYIRALNKLVRVYYDGGKKNPPNAEQVREAYLLELPLKKRQKICTSTIKARFKDEGIPWPYPIKWPPDEGEKAFVIVDPSA